MENSTSSIGEVDGVLASQTHIKRRRLLFDPDRSRHGTQCHGFVQFARAEGGISHVHSTIYTDVTTPNGNVTRTIPIRLKLMTGGTIISQLRVRH